MSTSTASATSPPSSASSTPPAVQTNTNNNNSGGGPQNSPLLFFVALGFGVVFTNLWIIVGVKYCFRYNARNRRGVQDENGEPIDLANLTQHRRRRREKKLMTIDEVNERFPITKYKTWVSTRAAQGLPTEGGVSQSRAASVRDAEGTIEPIVDSSKSVVTADVASTTEAHDPLPPSTPTTSSAPKEATSPSAKTIETTTEKAIEDETRPDTSRVENAASEATPATATETETARPAASTHSGDDDEDPIPAAIPGAAEMLEAPGDSCAICIDTLEEEEDVRGLSCGHAFHATCIDPWLTNRRACCPLCKADYYVPKPRPDQPLQPAQEEGENGQQASEQADEIRRPSIAATLPAGGISRYMPRLTGRFDALPPERTQRSRSRPGRSASTPDAGPADAEPASGGRLHSIFSFGRRNNSALQATEEEANQAPEPTSESSQQEQSRGRRWAPSLPNWRRARSGGDAAPTDGSAPPTTPGQLEAGRTATTTTTTNV